VPLILSERVRARPPNPATVFVALLVTALLALHLLWLNEFRFGYVTEWDESGYISIALDNVHALRGGGPTDLVDTVLSQDLQAPLLPFTAVPFNLVFGDGVNASLAAELPFYALLVFATYGLGRRLLPSWWAALAAGCVAGIPLALDYTRIFHFSVPAAAMFTAALWALLRTDRMSSRRWAIATGVLLGLTLLSRTMTIAYLPGFVAAATVLALVGVERRRERLVNLALSLGIGAIIAAVWYLPNRHSIGAYLLHYGYGAESGSYGASHSVLSIAYWTAEARALIADLYLPLASVLLIALIAAAVSAINGPRPRVTRGDLIAWLATAPAVLLLVVIEGYLVLSSSRNQGTAFALPWLPALVVLVVAAARSIRPPTLRIAVASLIAGVSLYNVAMKSDFVGPISGAATADVPGVGEQPVSDARGLIQLEVAGSGYPIGRATERLPDLHKQWLPFAGEVVQAGNRYAADHGRRASLAVGLDDTLLGNTRFKLASQLELGQSMPTTFIKPFDGDDVASYRDQLEAARNNLLITGEATAGNDLELTPGRVREAARAVGFRPVVGRFETPDGRQIVLWWRDIEPPAELYE
jgi:Dolichyl-phosphate-mannose-protein mannosyltransferase